MPIPQECARKGWIAGRAIVLGDDNEWDFPLPRVSFRLTESGPLERKNHNGRETNTRYGPRFWDLQRKLGEYMDRTSAIADGEAGCFDLVEYYRLLRPVAADLLRRNYDLDDGQLDDLLYYTPGCEINKAMWIAINEVAVGIGGRPDAVDEAG